MKQLLFLLSICLSFTLNAQDRNLVIRQITCEDGTEKAINNFNKGIYKVYSFGLTSSIGDNSFGEYYSNYVFKKYGVQFESMGCVVMTSDKCYADKMTELLYDKYGEDMFEVARKEARKSFKSSEGFNEIRERINSNDLFYTVHEDAEFIGGKENFEKFLGKKIGFNEHSDWEDYLTVSFIVEKDGTVSNIELENFIDNEPYLGKNAEVLINKLKSMPKWNPGIYFDEIVRTSISIRILK